MQPPRSSSPYWDTPLHATMVGALEGAAQPWQERGTLMSPPAAPATGITRAGWGGSASSALRGSTSFVLFLFVLLSFLLFFFALGDQEPGPSSRHLHKQHPRPRPWAKGTGQAAAMCHRGAIKHRSLLLWPGPSALCLCPAVRLSCWPSPGGPRSARSRGIRSLRSGRSS